jgi:hypothetical protein
VKEPALLVSVQRIIGGIEIERDLAGRLGVRIQEQIDKQRLDRPGIGADPGIAAGFGSSRFKVLLPASGAQSLRRASSLPANTASTGSWRSSSWSTRSS